MPGGLLMGLLTVTLGVNQHVSGLGITLLLTGCLAVWLPPDLRRAQRPALDRHLSEALTPFEDMPVLGPIFEQYCLTYLAILLVPLVVVAALPHQLSA